jgi:hypothetical protein
MDSSSLFVGALMLVVIGFAIVSMVWRQQRADEMLRQWAGRNGYELLSAEYCWFWRGPYWLGTSKSQMVYRIQVRAGDEVRSGYARLGGWFLGMWSDEVDVSWD